MIRSGLFGLFVLGAAAITILEACSSRSGTPTMQIARLMPNSVATSLPTGAATEYPIPTGGPGGNTSGPEYIVKGPDGDLWFNELAAVKIGRITPNGSITEFSVPTATCKYPQQPLDLITGPDNNLWVTDNCPIIWKVTATGTFTPNPISDSFRLSSIASGADSRLWFTEVRVSSDGSTVVAANIGAISLSGAITQYKISSGNCCAPYWITEGPDSNLWFAYTGDVGRITAAGAICLFPLSPYGTFIANGSDGNLWIVGGSPYISRVTTTGAATLFNAVVGSVPAIVAGPDGNMWFTVDGGTSTGQDVGYIGRVSASGQMTVFELPFPGSVPHGITVGSDNNIWFTDIANNAIGVLNLSALDNAISVRKK